MAEEISPTDGNQIQDSVVAELMKSLRHLAKRFDEVADEISDIKSSLASGTPIIEAVKSLPTAFAVLHEQVKTLRMIVYGAVGICLAGMLTTWGAAIVFFLRVGHQ